MSTSTEMKVDTEPCTLDDNEMDTSMDTKEVAGDVTGLDDDDDNKQITLTSKDGKKFTVLNKMSQINYITSPHFRWLIFVAFCCTFTKYCTHTLYQNERMLRLNKLNLKTKCYKLIIWLRFFLLNCSHFK